MLISVNNAVLVTSNNLVTTNWVTVGSLLVFPSVSSPSSLTSLTSFVFPGLLPITVTVFWILPLETSFWVIV